MSWRYLVIGSDVLRKNFKDTDLEYDLIWLYLNNYCNQSISFWKISFIDEAIFSGDNPRREDLIGLDWIIDFLTK